MFAPIPIPVKLSLWERIRRWFYLKFILPRKFNKFAFPMIRKIYPSILSSEIFSVQPMQAPVGLKFYFDTTIRKFDINKFKKLYKLRKM
jgi:hypothetical protein